MATGDGGDNVRSTPCSEHAAHSTSLTLTAATAAAEAGLAVMMMMMGRLVGRG